MADVARPLTFLHWGFWGCVSSFAVAMGVGQLLPADTAALSPELLVNALLVVFFVCACVYWTALGIIAHRTGRSAALWIVAGLATLAVGFIVTYWLMATRARLA